jgi:hypothetical protein
MPNGMGGGMPQQQFPWHGSSAGGMQGMGMGGGMMGGGMMGGGMGGGMMGGGMMGGGGGDAMSGGGDMTEVGRVMQDPTDPGSAAARQAFQSAQSQGLSHGQSLVAAAEAYERATGKPMPGAPSGAKLQSAKQYQNHQARLDQDVEHVAEQKASQASQAKEGATVVTLYWEGASKCAKINSQPAPSVSGNALIMTNLTTGTTTKQKTRAVTSTSPCWKETMEWQIVDFDKVSPRLSLSLLNEKGACLTEYNLIDLKKIRATHGGRGYWLQGVDFSVQNSSSQLAGKVDLRVRITFS